jgi:F-type H+-transporting ATPase subunit gamma
MDNASKNAQELIDELTLVLNNVRQGNITRELTEIVGAGKAIKQWA